MSERQRRASRVGSERRKRFTRKRNSIFKMRVAGKKEECSYSKQSTETQSGVEVQMKRWKSVHKTIDKQPDGRRRGRKQLTFSRMSIFRLLMIRMRIGRIRPLKCVFRVLFSFQTKNQLRLPEFRHLALLTSPHASPRRPVYEEERTSSLAKM